MTSTSGSTTPSAKAVRRAAVIARDRPSRVRGAAGRLEAVAQAAGVELVGEETDSADLAVVLGGDGTMLRALQRFLGTGVPVFGVNFGRVGFLASVDKDDLEDGLRRAFAGDFRVVELTTLEVEVDGTVRPAVNDVVALSATRGRMVELGWAVGGEDLGEVPCDGIICAAPSGSTAYNLSNGGPVLMWGLDAMVITFIAPHKLDARPRVLARGPGRVVENRGRGSDDHRRRPRGRRNRVRRVGDDPTRRAAQPARDTAGGDLLPAVPGRVRLPVIRCQTSVWLRRALGVQKGLSPPSFGLRSIEPCSAGSASRTSS
jgi:NAD+ kinase